MYKILKSTDQGLDELELEHLEKGYWLDIVAPSVEELQEIAAATKIQMDFLSAALDEEEKSRIEVEDDQILILVDIPFLRSNKDYDTLPLGIVVTEEGIATICLEPNAVTADFGTHNSKMFSTFKKTRFLFQILYKSATLYLKYIRIIIRRTDELEIHLRQSMENSELFNLLDLQKSLTYFSTSLRSNFCQYHQQQPEPGHEIFGIRHHYFGDSYTHQRFVGHERTCSLCRKPLRVPYRHQSGGMYCPGHCLPAVEEENFLRLENV